MAPSPEHPQTPGAVGDLLLERFALGELPPERLAAIQALVDADPTLQARLRDLRNDNRAILMQHPPRQVVARIRDRAGVAAPRKRSPWFVAAPVLAMAALALLFVTSGDPIAPNDRAKGSAGTVEVDAAPELHVFREDDGELSSGDLARAGEVLGFRYDAAGYDFGALFSIDGAGVVTLHMPDSPGSGLAVDDGLVTLSLGYELDDAPDFERFFLVLSDTPFNLSAVLDAAAELARGDARTSPLQIDEELQVVDFTVDKDPP